MGQAQGVVGQVVLAAGFAALLGYFAWRKGKSAAHWSAMGAWLLFGHVGLVFPLAALIALSFSGWQCPLCERELSRAQWKAGRAHEKPHAAAEPGVCPRCGAKIPETDR